MDTPVQHQPQPNQEVGVSQASSSEGAAYMQDLMGSMLGGAPNLQQSTQQVQPVPQVQPVQQEQQVQLNQQPTQPTQQPPAQPAQQPPAQPTQQVSYSNRYSGDQATDPLANLQTIPELTPEQQIAAPQNMSEQQNHSWAAMRSQSNAYRKKAEEFRTKYNQLVESTKKIQAEHTDFGAQLTQKDNEIRALQDDIGRMDLTRSPAFREKYDTPLMEVQGDIARTLMDNGYGQEQAIEFAGQLITAKRDELPELIQRLPVHAQGIIMVNTEKADALWAARNQAVQDWRTSTEGLAAVEARGSAMVTAQHIDQLTQKAIDIIHTMPANNGQIPAYQVLDPAFVADRDSKEHEFRSWVQHAPEEQKYAAMLEGFMAPKTYEMLDTIMKENQELKQALNNRGRLAAPPIAPSHVNWAPPPAPPPPRPTVKQNGYEEVEAVNPAQAIARGIVSQFMPRQ